MVATLQAKYCRLCSMMNEKLRRHWAACEALALGRGGMSTVASATGLSRNTIRQGIREIQAEMPGLAGELERPRIRREGGGRHPLSATDGGLKEDLQALVEATTRGDPMCPLLWTCKSTRKLATELNKQGHTVSHSTVATLLDELGYSLQANRKMREGGQHPDRDAQFQFIAKKVRSFQGRCQPVISVDTKKKELLGDFRNSGREYHKKKTPEQVRMHDFKDKRLGIAIPHGIYDLTRNEGWVSVGIDHDTAEFAVSSIARWWRKMGSRVYLDAEGLLITADGGGSNACRSRFWKLCVQRLADEIGLTISVCHFPPGTSKWNKIEHRMFCHITENWRGRPLISRAVVVNLIGHTTTEKGLKIRAALDEHEYKTGIKVTDEELASISITPDKFHGEWNYRITPRS
jgi:transposase